MHLLTILLTILLLFVSNLTFAQDNQLLTSEENLGWNLEMDWESKLNIQTSELGRSHFSDWTLLPQYNFSGWYLGSEIVAHAEQNTGSAGFDLDSVKIFAGLPEWLAWQNWSLRPQIEVGLPTFTQSQTSGFLMAPGFSILLDGKYDFVEINSETKLLRSLYSNRVNDTDFSTWQLSEELSAIFPILRKLDFTTNFIFKNIWHSQFLRVETLELKQFLGYNFYPSFRVELGHAIETIFQDVQGQRQSMRFFQADASQLYANVIFRM